MPDFMVQVLRLAPPIPTGRAKAGDIAGVVGKGQTRLGAGRAANAIRAAVDLGAMPHRVVVSATPPRRIGHVKAPVCTGRQRARPGIDSSPRRSH
jgi:hypothetical protein